LSTFGGQIRQLLDGESINFCRTNPSTFGGGGCLRVVHKFKPLVASDRLHKGGGTFRGIHSGLMTEGLGFRLFLLLVFPSSGFRVQASGLRF